jgi:hypothetical protein
MDTTTQVTNDLCAEFLEEVVSLILKEDEDASATWDTIS